MARADAKQGGSAAAGFVAGFAPWIVYWILSGSTSFEVAVGVAFGIAVLTSLVNVVRHRPLMVLEVGTAFAFAGLAVVGEIAGDAWVSRWIQPLGNGALLAIMLVLVLIGKPFTLQYAKAATTPDLWDSPGFLAVNVFLTWVWVGALGIMTVLSLIPPIVQGQATRHDGASALSIACYWVLPYAFLGLAMVFTIKYPDWFGAEFADVAPVTGKTEAPLPTSAVEDHADVGAMTLDVRPQPALIDDPIAVSLRGIAPGASVAVSATNVDLAGNVWRSNATFAADAAGALDTARDGVDADALIWDMRFATEGATPQMYIPPPGATAVAVEARVDGATLTKTLVRQSCAPDVVVRDVNNDGVVGRLFLPPGDGPFPAVALYGGSEGGIDSEYSNAALLASRGFVALTVGYFGLDGLDDALVSIPLERLAAGVRALAKHERVDAGRIGAIAISRGAEGVLSMAARLGDVPLAAIVAISPSTVAWTAMGDAGTMPGVPSWTADGEAVPHLDVADKVLMDQAMWDALRHRGKRDPYHPNLLHLTRAYAAGLEDTTAADAAAIPVERIAAPVLLLSGSDDAVWPSGPMADAIVARRHAAGCETQHQHYEGAGHLFRLGCLPTDVTTAGGIALGGTREGIAAAQADATKRVLEFLSAQARRR